MKLKLCLLLLILSIGYDSLAASVVENNNARMTGKPTSIVRSSYYDNNTSSADYSMILEELKTKVDKNPNNYSLYVPLIDAYIKTKNYKDAFNELSFLLSLKDQNKLSDSILKQIQQLYMKTAEANRYSRSNSPVYVNLAMMSLILNNNDLAEKYIKKAVVNVSDSELMIDGIKTVFDYTGNLDGAVSVCNLYSSLNKSDNPDLRRLKISYLLQSNNITAALNEYQDYIKNPNVDDNAMRYEIYEVLAAKNSSDKEIIKTLYPATIEDESFCYFDLYKLLQSSDSYTDAKKYAAKLEKSYPNSVYTGIVKAEALMQAGKVDEAKEVMEALKSKLTTTGDIEIYNSIVASMSAQPVQEAFSLFNQGHYQSALSIVEKLPSSVGTLALRARCYIELGQMQNALDLLNQAMAIGSDSFVVNGQFGYYYYALGDYTTARKYINSCLSEQPDYEPALVLLDKLNQVDAQRYVNQIISAFDAQNYAEAMRIINKALKIDPKSAELYYYKGLTYIAQNNYAASTAALYKSLELDNSNVLSYYFLGIAFDNLSEHQNALANYKKFVQLFPDDEYGESDKIRYAQSRIKKLQGIK